MTSKDEDWTVEDSAAATKEGWDLFYCLGSADDDLQIQMFDDPSEIEESPIPYPFKSDEDAWEHVVGKSKEPGGSLHRRALALIKNHNYSEFERIMRCDRSLHV